MSASTPAPITSEGLQALIARVASLETQDEAREERIALLEEENRWLKGQLFGRSSEKTPLEDLIVAANWYLGPRFYLSYAIDVPVAMVTAGLASLLIFGTIDSVRRRLATRKRKNAVS